jgi:predicted alpha/beta-fold hydrolase
MRAETATLLDVASYVSTIARRRDVARQRLTDAGRLGLLFCLIEMSAQHSSIRSLFLDGPAGRLEALLNMGAEHATHAALVCHPHPLYGGTLHNKVVFHTMKALNHFGYPVLRFNFRGAGLSQGEHDHGNGELEDVRTALDWLDREFHLQLIFAGFSFGAAVGLRVACPMCAWERRSDWVCRSSRSMIEFMISSFWAAARNLSYS